MAIEEIDLIQPEPRVPSLSERRAAAIVLHLLQPHDAVEARVATRADIAALGGSDPDAMMLAHAWFNQITS